MAAVTLNEGKELLFRQQMGSTGGKSPQALRLFSNNFTPSETSVLANFTECTGSGYLAATLAGADWSYTFDALNNAWVASATKVFTFTGALTIWGAYCTDTPATKGMYAEKFGAVVNIGASGGNLTVTVNVTRKQCP